MSLKSKVFTGTVWIGVERFGQQGIQFFVSILLARMLEPAEFGLVAMVAIFMAFSAHLVNGGFQSALIQKKDATHVDESTVFWFNLAISALMTLALWFLAPWIARFYEQPKLVSVTRWISFTLFLNGFAVVQFALLQKELLFGLRTIATISSTLAAGLVSVVMALKGYGVWSLVALQLVSNLTRVVVIWTVHSWRPLFVFSIASFKSLFSFGSRLLGCSLMNAVFENIYQLIIGRIYTATDLGFFQRAKRFMMLFAYTPYAMVTQIHFPYLCKIQGDAEQAGSAFCRFLKYSVMFTMPLLVGMAVAAPNMIVVLVGGKWLPCVSYLRIMCFTGILYIIYMLNQDVIKAWGHSGKIFKLEAVKRGLLVFSIIILYRHGISALLYGELFCTLVTTLLMFRVVHSYVHAGIAVQLKWLMPYAVASAVMAAVVYMLGFSSFGVFFKLGVQVLGGAGTYILVLLLLRDREFLTLLKACLNGMQRKTV